MLVVVKRVLPAELRARGVKDADDMCSLIASRIAGMASAATTAGSSAEDVFRRLGGG